MVTIAEKERLTMDTGDASHFVYATPTLPRKDMLECLRLNAAAFRVLSSAHHVAGGTNIRDKYFEAKDALKVTNVELLQYLAKEFFEYLQDRDVVYVKPDFPDAEVFATQSVKTEIPDEWLGETLERVQRSGLN